MGKLMVVGRRATIAQKDDREDPEEYWDRAWALAAAGGSSTAWEDSMFAHAKARGAVYRGDKEDEQTTSRPHSLPSKNRTPLN